MYLKAVPDRPGIGYLRVHGVKKDATNKIGDMHASCMCKTVTSAFFSLYYRITPEVLRKIKKTLTNTNKIK